jgi:hypothetical protein
VGHTLIVEGPAPHRRGGSAVVCLEEIDSNDRSRCHVHLGGKGPHRVTDDTEYNIRSFRVGVEPVLVDQRRDPRLRHIGLQEVRSHDINAVICAGAHARTDHTGLRSQWFQYRGVAVESSHLGTGTQSGH